MDVHRDPIATVPAGGWLTDRSGRVDAFIVAGCAACALATALLVAGAPVLAPALLYGLAIGAWPGAIMTLPSKVLSPRGRSTGFGVFYTAYYAGMAALPPAAGWLRDTTGEATASVLFGGLLMLGAIAVLGLFRQLQRRLAPASR